MLDNKIKEYLMDLLKVFLISMIPVLELRAAIPLGITTFNLPAWETLLIAVLGNLAPIPFLILFGEKVLNYLSKFEKIGKPFRFIIEHGEKKAKKVVGALFLGLLLFVAVPLPGTGAWTGALIAITLRLKVKEAFPAIVLGVICAAIIMTLVTLGLVTIF